MKKILLLIFLSFSIVPTLFAQKTQNISITGKVIDSISNHALEYATIILKKKNSEDISGDITDKNGEFNISAAKGNYTIVIEFLSYKSIIYSNFELNENIDLEIIKLSPSSESLSAIEINGNSNIINFELGKKVYYPEKDISAQSSTAIELLENTPSVSIENGKPIIKGHTALVLINGRYSSFAKLDALQNLQASSIKKIEIITTPSAKYRADSSGGIINIILKKGLDNGLNGSVTTTAGVEDIYGAATSINYRKNKLNLYTNTSYFHREPFATTIIDNEYTENGITTGFLNENRTNLRKNNVLNTSLGMDYYFNDFISLNLEGNYSKFNGDFCNSNISNYSDANNSLTKTTQQSLFTNHKNDIYDLSATYSQYFERENEEISIIFSHTNDIEVNNSLLNYNDLFPTYITYPEKDEQIFDDIDLLNTYWLAAYKFPTNETSTLEFGYEATLGKVEHDFLNEIISDGDFIPNPDTSNLLHYTENWHGLYSEFKKEYEKFSFGAAVRVEHTNLDINLITTNEQNTQKYTDIFPSLELNFIKNKNKSISFVYRRSIQRVGYPDLNPFEQRISETTSYTGNVNLLPYYSNMFELNFLSKKNQKFILNPSLYFRRYNDIWQDITIETGEIVNGVPKLVTTPINLGYLNFTGIELLANYKPNDWLEFNSTLDFNYRMRVGKYEYTDSNDKVVTLDYNNTGFGGSAKVITTMKLPLGVNFQTLIKYYLPSEGAYSKRYEYAFMNATLSKELFHKKATLSLSAKDIFNSNKTKRLRWTDDVNSLSDFQWRERTILLSFTYRFNQSKKDKSIDINIKDNETNY